VNKIRRHLKNWWGAYLLALFIAAWLAVGAYVAVGDNTRKHDCIAKNHYYIDHECYKVVIHE
jgi:hypothetical protein